MPVRLRVLLEITRPVNVIIGMGSIYVGAWVTTEMLVSSYAILACFSGGLILAAGNVLNDYYDLEIDAVNKRFRPLPSGRLNRQDAANFSIILFVLGIFLSIFLGFIPVLIAFTAILALYSYCSRLKYTVLWGNLNVSLLASLAFVYGGLGGREWERALIPAALAFFFHLGREIIKDIEDQSADRKSGLKTLSIRYGDRVALVVATNVFILLILVTFIPYIFEVYGKGYLWAVVFGVDTVILASLIYLWLKPAPQAFRRVSAILKADMVVGLGAVILGATT